MNVSQLPFWALSVYFFWKSLNLNKKIFQSTSKQYVQTFLNQQKIINSDVVEIHNRPLILFNLIKEIETNFIFYFHNDPLSMKGSKRIDERLLILKNCAKIIFVSEWVRNRFFLNIDKKLTAKTEVVYPSVHAQRNLKKEKIISFVGRLNYSKGYDIFEKSIVKILDEFPEWNALSIGDEDRRSIYINHKQHKEMGFLNHKSTLNKLSKSEIAVVPSRWEEPFGRTSLEASANGCAVIITNRGGLPCLLYTSPSPRD